MHSGNSIKFISGNSHPELAQAIADRMGVTPTACSVRKFSNGETSVRIHESVRDEDVFILQTSCGPDVNDVLMELLILISACKTASARRITAIVPCYPYARNTQKDKSRAPITAKLVANMILTAGCDHVITMDLHAGQIQGFFDIPVDNLYSEPVLIGFIKRCIPGWKDAVVVSPDAGGAKRATAIADKLNVDFALFHRSRKHGKALSGRSMTDSIGSLRTANGRDYIDEAEDLREDENLELLVGSVEGKIAVLVDDMIDTGETMMVASTSLIENGASQVWILVGHCLAMDFNKLASLPIERLVVTNTVPIPVEQNSNLIKLIPPTPVPQSRTTSRPHSRARSPDIPQGLTPASPSHEREASTTTNGILINGTGSESEDDKHKLKLTILDVSPMLAESIRRTHNGESISLLFGEWAEKAAFMYS